MNRISSPLFRLILLFLASAIPPLQAQLTVTVAIDRTNYISYEPLPVTVTVTNTSGNDVVLGGPNNSSWLNFLVTSESGRPVTALTTPGAEAIVCRNGQSLQRRYNLPRYFHLIDSGGYLVKGSVYFADLQRWVTSRPVRFTINQAAKPRWEQTFALPKGHRMAGKYRRYQLFNFHDTNRSYLYIRIIDESTGMFISTFPVSSLVPERDVQPAVDFNQNLHVLCLASPQIWAHHTVDPEGRLVNTKFYKQSRGQPQLTTQASGEVMILGGTPYDPSAKPAAPEPGGDSIRRLSDRPSGLPLR